MLLENFPVVVISMMRWNSIERRNNEKLPRTPNRTPSFSIISTCDNRKIREIHVKGIKIHNHSSTKIHNNQQAIVIGSLQALINMLFCFVNTQTQK